jgi:hypothetical protein
MLLAAAISLPFLPILHHSIHAISVSIFPAEKNSIAENSNSQQLYIMKLTPTRGSGRFMLASVELCKFVA